MASESMTVHCFDVLVKYFHQEHDVDTSRFSDCKTSFPLFVTWSKRDRIDGWSLRGCIGTFSALRLEHGLRKFSLSSALRDKRFSSMRREEIPDLRCDVSLLTDFEVAKHHYDWTIGVHGIQIDFQGRHDRYSGTYLPQVAVDQGWTKDETLISLIRKAGFSGRLSDVMKTLQVTRYRSSKHSLTFDEYVELRAMDGINVCALICG
uniref:AMME syndrome candidate 1 protein n=1 Tax=Hirondellea gigas TaxID=1518452 RepID=A0A2P2I9K3_9CRUS